MNITTRELELLNIYCTSALHSARWLGRAARRTQDPELCMELARRAADAVRQARYWAETARAVGGAVTPAETTLHEQYTERFGQPSNLLDVLTLSQLYERRLARQLLQHFHQPGTHPVVRATLRRVIEEEVEPEWATRWLDRASHTLEEQIHKIRGSYAQIEAALPDTFAPAAALRRAA
jgi:hypothetical protein